MPQIKVDDIITNVRFDEHSLFFDLSDGRTLSAPLEHYPRLLKATPEQRRNWERIGRGYGVHWPEVDEDVSVRGMERVEN
jgi:hypothetical protein